MCFKINSSTYIYSNSIVKPLENKEQYGNKLIPLSSCSYSNNVLCYAYRSLEIFDETAPIEWEKQTNPYPLTFA